MQNEENAAERRAFVRKPCAFDVVWKPQNAPETKGMGFEVSTEGLVFALPVKTFPASMVVTALIRGTTINVTAEVLRKDAIPIQGSFWTKAACRITAVDEAAWEAIIESIPVRAQAQPIPPGVEAVLSKKAKAPEKAVAPSIPPEIKERIAKMLVKRERMDPPAAGQAPAIVFAHMGEQLDPLGRKAQHFKVDSTRVRQGKPETLSTIVAVVEGGELMIVRE